MSYQKVEAGRGIDWLKRGIDLVKANPVVFIVDALIIGLIVGLLSMIPLLGQIGVALLMPVLVAGLLYSYREQDEGRPAEIGQLFRGFQEQGRIGPLLMLGLPAIAAMVLVFVLAFVFLGGAILGAAASGGAESATALAGLGGGLVLFMLLMFAVFLAAMMLVVFAIPRVMFDGVEPIAAMKESLSASLANIGAFLVFAVVMFVIYLVSAILLIIPILGWLAFCAILLGLVAVSNAAVYLAYRDIFGGSPGTTADLAPPAPPAPPVV
jgi:uncharacterized membrane protein